MFDKDPVTMAMLPVRYAFHTQEIEPLKHLFLQKMTDKMKYSMPKINYISGEKGYLIREVDAEYYWVVLRNKMHFQEAIQTLNRGDYKLIDVSPSGTLCNFAKMILRKQAGIFSII